MVFKKILSVLALTSLLVTLIPQAAFAVTGSTQDPDLTVSDIYVDDSGYLNIEVSNTGLSDVSSTTGGVTKIYVDNLNTASWTYSWGTLSDKSFMTSGDSSTLRPQTLDDSAHTVMACVDTSDVVTEADEDNNCLTVDLGNDLPNLVLTSITIDSDDKLNVTVGNEGDVDVSSATAGRTYIWIDDMNTAAWNYLWTTLSNKDFLQAGESSTIRPQVLEGAHTVKACVDYTDLVEESSEDDNCLTETFESGLADLVVQDISLDDDSYLNVTIGNEGDIDVPSTTAGHTYVYIDGAVKYTYSWGTLADKSFLQVDSSSTMTPTMLTGSHTVQVCVDANDVVQELDEDNNCLEVSFDAGLPDLVLQDLYLSGDTLSIKVGNEGDAPAEITTGGVTYIWVDGVLNKTYSWKTLADQSFVEVGGSSILQPFNVTETHTIKACVDYLGSVTESDENNNCKETTFTISATSESSDLPDLVLQDIYIDESNRLSVQVSNEGDTDVDTDVALYIYVDDLNNPEYTYNSSTFSEDNREFLDADGVSTIQPRILDEDETYDVKACVDATGLVTESNESNNCLTVTDLEADVVYEYVADDDDVDADVADVDGDDVFSDFASLWTDSDYPKTLYLSVNWGYKGDGDQSVTDWDGKVNFEGAVLGRPMQTIAFESSEDYLDFGNTNPTMTSFVSDIHESTDGILFKLKTDLDPDVSSAEPFVAFETAFEDTSIELFLDDLVDDGEYVYDSFNADGYEVVFRLVTQDGWINQLKEKALISVRIGNLDGEGSASGEAHLYTVNLAVSDGSVIPAYMPVLLETHADYSGYDDLSRDDDKKSLTLKSGIFGHMDGFLTMLSLVDAKIDRYIEVTVTDEDGDTVFEQKFTKDVDLGVFDLDDGTGNKIEIVNLLANRSDLIDRAEEIFEEMFSWESQVSRFGAVISDLIDTGEMDDDVIDEMNSVLESLLTLMPGDDDDTVLPGFYKDITVLTANLRAKLNAYLAGTLTGDELNDAVAEAFDLAQTKLEAHMTATSASAGYMSDVDYAAWYAKYMDMAMAHAFFAGYKDAAGQRTGYMGPANQLTRFELIKIMSELAYNLDMGLGETACDPSTVTLTSDVDWMGSHWSKGYVQCIYNSGMDLTILNDVIKEQASVGNNPVLRWEVIQLGFEILGAEYTDYTEFSFPDIGEGSGVYDDTSDMIQTAYDLGVINGYPDGTFGPFKTVNRAEMFKIITLLESVFSQVEEPL